MNIEMQETNTESNSETINQVKETTDEISPSKARRKKILGIICLLGVVILWVGSSILMQYIFTNQDFNKPFFLTYLDTSFFTIYLLGFIFRRKKWMEIARAKPSENNNNISPQNKSEDATSLLANGSETNKTSDKLNLKQVVILSLLFCPLWFIDNYTFNLSLAMTSVSSNTILSSTSSLFTLILTVIMKVEKFNIIKLFGVLLTLGGVIMVSLSDTRNQGKDSIWGDVLALFSALTYALYVSLFKKRVRDEERVDNGMFLGFLGLFNAAMLWPIIFILNVTKAETFVAPTGMVLLYLVLNSLFGTALSDYLWLQAVLLISPVVATVGLSLTIPVAMVSDMLIKRTSFPIVYIFGSIFVAIGFIVVNVDNMVIDYVKKRWNKYKALNQ